MDKEVKAYANKHGMSMRSIGDVSKTILKLWGAGGIPCLHGGTGIGKTAIAYQLADMVKGKTLILDCSILQPEDYCAPVRGSDGYLDIMYAWWVKEIEENSKSGVPTVLVFDEITRHADGAGSALFGILGSRRLGDYRFPDNCFIYAACNPAIKGFAVQDILSEEAWRRRLRHIAVAANVSDFLCYGKQVNLHTYVMEYLQFNVDHLIDYPAKAAGKIFACPANWELVSDFLKANKDDLDIDSLATYLNEDRASAFKTYVEETAYRIHPKTLLEDVNKCKATLDKISADGRQDLIPRLVSAITLFLYREKPNPAVAGKNLALYWATLTAELKVKLNQGLLEGKKTGGDESYWGLLMAVVQEQPCWVGEIYDEVKYSLGK